MRIIILSEGPRGDNEPYVDLAKALMDVGHELLVCNFVLRTVADEYKGINENTSLVQKKVYSFDNDTIALEKAVPFYSYPTHPEYLSGINDYMQYDRVKVNYESDYLTIWETSMQNMFASFRRTRYVRAKQMLEIVQKFEPDLIIQGTIYSDALSIGESLGIKVIRTLLWPAIPTDEFPLLTHRAYVIHGAWGKAVQAVENRRDTYLDSILRWEKNIEAINQRRQEIFGLFPLTMEELIDQYDQIPSLVGYSSQYLPVASDWKNAHYTGFWKDLENDCDEKRIDPHLKEFIESGSTPVYIGFGSMINDWIGRDSRFITEMLIRALMTSKQRGVVLYGMAKLSLELLTPENTKSYYELIDYAKKNILFIVAVPHSWLFPRCSVIIHHGGIGTTTTSILSGRPNIIMPVFFDQPIISHGVEKIKAGIKLPNLAGCTYEMIAQAIDTCLTDPSIIAGIKTASDKIMEECKNSLSIATKTIEFLCANYKWPWEIK